MTLKCWYLITYFDVIKTQTRGYPDPRFCVYLVVGTYPNLLFPNIVFKEQRISVVVYRK